MLFRSYTTFWINRAGHPAEQLDVSPSGTGHDMNDLLEFARTRGAAI